MASLRTYLKRSLNKRELTFDKVSHDIDQKKELEMPIMVVLNPDDTLIDILQINTLDQLFIEIEFLKKIYINQKNKIENIIFFYFSQIIISLPDIILKENEEIKKIYIKSNKKCSIKMVKNSQFEHLFYSDLELYLMYSSIYEHKFYEMNSYNSINDRNTFFDNLHSLIKYPSSYVYPYTRLNKVDVDSNLINKFKEFISSIYYNKNFFPYGNQDLKYPNIEIFNFNSKYCYYDWNIREKFEYLIKLKNDPSLIIKYQKNPLNFYLHKIRLQDSKINFLDFLRYYLKHSVKEDIIKFIDFIFKNFDQEQITDFLSQISSSFFKISLSFTKWEKLIIKNKKYTLKIPAVLCKEKKDFYIFINPKYRDYAVLFDTNSLEDFIYFNTTEFEVLNSNYEEYCNINENFKNNVFDSTKLNPNIYDIFILNDDLISFNKFFLSFVKHIDFNNLNYFDFKKYLINIVKKILEKENNKMLLIILSFCDYLKKKKLLPSDCNIIPSIEKEIMTKALSFTIYSKLKKSGIDLIYSGKIDINDDLDWILDEKKLTQYNQMIEEKFDPVAINQIHQKALFDLIKIGRIYLAKFYLSNFYNNIILDQIIDLIFSSSKVFNQIESSLETDINNFIEFFDLIKK